MNPTPPRKARTLYQRMTGGADVLADDAEEAAVAKSHHVVERARQLDGAAAIEGWLSSPELKPPS